MRVLHNGGIVVDLGVGCDIMALVETKHTRAFALSNLKSYTINPKSAPRVLGLDN